MVQEGTLCSQNTLISPPVTTENSAKLTTHLITCCFQRVMSKETRTLSAQRHLGISREKDEDLPLRVNRIMGHISSFCFSVSNLQDDGQLLHSQAEGNAPG